MVHRMTSFQRSTSEAVRTHQSAEEWSTQPHNGELDPALAARDGLRWVRQQGHRYLFVASGIGTRRVAYGACRDQNGSRS